MRSVVITLLACIIVSASSLPFKVKQLVNEDNEQATEKQLRKAAKEVKNDLQQDFVTSSSIVASYFSSEEDDSISISLKESIHQMANTQDMHEFILSTRRSLHRNPELMYELPQTSQTIATILDELNIPYTTGWAKNTHQEVYPGPGGYGIVAHIGKNINEEDQPCIILRADMDALPILEATKNIESFKSKTNHQMHACGHDGHVTMLLGAAALLKSVESEIEGTVRLVFQPAEEGGAGMKRMVEEGLVELKPQAKLGFGMHVWPTIPSGVIATRPGALMAAAEMFTVEIHGKGGHAAMPHLTIDPIVAVSSLISNLQSIVSRTISPLESGVISVTAIEAGYAHNVIPGSAMLKGTIRALSTEMLMSLRDKFDHMVTSSAMLHGCNATIQYSPDFYVPTINDKDLFEWSSKVGALVSKEGKVRDIEPTMGGEDFGFLADALPSTFFFLGQGSGGSEKYHIPRTDYGLHHPSFALDEDVLPIGVELHANLALRSLKKLAIEESMKTEL